MHWILLAICCASVYGGMVVKSPSWMAACFVLAVVSCVAWLWLRYTTLFPGGTQVTVGSAGLSDAEMEVLREQVRARTAQQAAPAPESLERPADPDAIRLAAQRVAQRDAEVRLAREASERAELAERAAAEQRTLEAARERIAQEDAARLAAAVPEPAVAPAPVDVIAPEAPAPMAQAPAKPQGPEREVGEVWNPYAGVVHAPKKDVQIHPTSGDAHRDA